MPDSALSFLSLPRELRDRVYDAYLNIEWSSSNCTKQTKRFYTPDVLDFRIQRLSRAAPLLRHEMYEHLFSPSNKFELSNWALETFQNDIMKHLFLPIDYRDRARGELMVRLVGCDNHGSNVCKSGVEITRALEERLDQETPLIPRKEVAVSLLLRESLELRSVGSNDTVRVRREEDALGDHYRVYGLKWDVHFRFPPRFGGSVVRIWGDIGRLGILRPSAQTRKDAEDHRLSEASPRKSVGQKRRRLHS